MAHLRELRLCVDYTRGLFITNMRSMEKIAFVNFLLIFLPIITEGVMFDFHFVVDAKRNATDNEKRCWELGYDGLAVVNSPEAFTYALQISKDIRTSTGLGVFIGLKYNSETGAPTWEDNSPVASDLPWTVDLNSGPDYPQGRINPDELFAMGRGDGIKYSFCGYHNNLPREVQGSTAAGQRPQDVTSILFEQSVPSYLSCVMLCGLDNRCRAAEFHLTNSNCRILGPQSFTDLTPSTDHQTFVRITYS